MNTHNISKQLEKQLKLVLYVEETKEYIKVRDIVT